MGPTEQVETTIDASSMCFPTEQAEKRTGALKQSSEQAEKHMDVLSVLSDTMDSLVISQSSLAFSQTTLGENVAAKTHTLLPAIVEKGSFPVLETRCVETQTVQMHLRPPRIPRKLQPLPKKSSKMPK